MAEMLDKADLATDYRRTAEEMAAKWKQMASEGDHYKLAFDQPGTWSMKYNLVWDKILGLGLFDPSISQTEVASYLKRQNNYGLPLDNRSEITKGDWIVSVSYTHLDVYKRQRCMRTAMKASIRLHGTSLTGTFGI